MKPRTAASFTVSRIQLRVFTTFIRQKNIKGCSFPWAIQATLRQKAVSETENRDASYSSSFLAATASGDVARLCPCSFKKRSEAPL